MRRPLIAGVLLAAAVLVPPGPAPAAPGEGAVVVCSPDGTTQRPKRKPRRCTLLPPGAPFANGANLAELKWSKWGGKTARATGIERGFHKPFSDIPVTVRAYRKRPCGVSRTYTRVKVTSTNGSTTVRFTPCADAGE